MISLLQLHLSLIRSIFGCQKYAISVLTESVIVGACCTVDVVPFPLLWLTIVTSRSETAQGFEVHKRMFLPFYGSIV
jgi:hypothetical protein